MPIVPQSGPRRRSHSSASHSSAAAALFVVLFIGGCGGLPAHSDGLDRGWLDASVAEAMQAFDVPGVAVAVVRDDRTLFAGGFGVREKGKAAPVDGDTLFQVGSLTKAFTAASLGLLVEQGKLDWDDRVIDHLPAFRLADPYVTREMTVRDLLAHNSGLGLGAGDLLFWPNAVSTRADVMAGLRHLEPVTSFRAGFIYNNLMYVVAAEVIEAVSGERWEEFVEKYIFAPLAMRDCAATYERSIDRGKHATPHMLVDGKLQATFFSPGAVLSSAGAINCSAAGMAPWASMLLARGRLEDGRQLIEERTIKRLWAPANMTAADDLLAQHARSRFRHYGLGWFVAEYKDDWLVEHGGTIHGASARIVLLPERSLGVVVFANQWTPITRALALQIVDKLLYAGETDWLTLYVDAYRKTRAENAAAAKTLPERNESACRDPVEGGDSATFRDPWYGDVTVFRDDTLLMIDLERTPSLVGPLRCLSDDRYVARWTDRTLAADAYVRFERGLDGAVEGMRLEWVDPNTDFSYDFHNLDPKRVRRDAER